MILTNEQQAVVDHPGGPLLVRAPAGSGKTTTTLAKIDRLIRDGVPAREILMSTFSRPGAADMRRKALSMGVPAGVAYRTLHSVALNIIRKARDHAVAARSPQLKPPELLVVSSDNRWKLIHILKRELRTAARSLGIPPDAHGRPAGYSVGDVAREISKAKAAIIAPAPWEKADGTVQPGYRQWATTRSRTPLSPGPAKMIAKVYRAYEAALRNPYKYDPDRFEGDRGASYLPFDDMIFHVAKAIEQGAAWVAPWHGIYRWVLVDETQDNSPGQWVLVRHLSAEKNLVAIGDDMQSIYGFRGAEPALMKYFLQDPALQVRLISLTVNFRSKQKILDAANGILAHARNRLDDSLMAPGRQDYLGGLVTVAQHANPGDEADAIVQDLAVAMGFGTSPDELCVLYRTNAQSGPIELACLKRGMPYRIAGSSFFHRPEVRTALSYLILAVDPTDAGAWRRAYCIPLRGLGRRFLASYPTLTSAQQDLHNGALRSSYTRGMRELDQHIDAIRRKLAEVDHPGDALHYIVEEIGIREHYRADDAGADDITEVDEACAALEDCARNVGDVARLVSFARDQAGIRTEDSNGEAVGVRPLVTLSTVHKAKGLEWQQVWVAGVTKTHFPHEQAPEDEERRLGYVAFTRPKDELHISYTSITIHGRPGGPSRLIAETGVNGEGLLDVAIQDAEETGQLKLSGLDPSDPGASDLYDGFV